jgi:phosphatidylglycerophosphate synthase
MKRALWPTVWLLVVALLAAGLSAISKMPFWWAFLIIAGAILINGWVATLEDDLPGGFNNPDGTHTPRYAVVTGWVIRGLGIVLALLCFAALGLYFFAAR